MSATAPESKEVEKKKEVAVEDHRIEVLMTYTVFHIGLYLSIIAALMAAEKGFALFEGEWITTLTAIVLLTVAGICGGIIAVNVAEFDPNADSISNFFSPPDEKNKKPGYHLKVWGKPWKCLWYERVARVEHVFFWTAVIVLVVTFAIHVVKHRGEDSAEKQAAATLVTTLTAASSMIAQRVSAVPPSPPVISVPGTGSCTGTTAGDVCSVNLTFGPSCIVTATGALSCTIPPIDPAKTPPPYPYQKCLPFKNAAGADYSVCDVIPDDKTRCAVSPNGQLQCTHW